MRKTRSAPSPIAPVEPSPLLLAVAQKLPGATNPVSVAGRPQLVQFDADDGRWLIRGLSSEQTDGLIASRHQFLAQPLIAQTGVAPLPYSTHSSGRIEEAPYEIVSYL